MSAAVMSTSAAVYDFGDSLLKSSNASSRHISAVRNVRWGPEPNSRAVGSPGTGAGPVTGGSAPVDFPVHRETVSRRASNPAPASASPITLNMTQALVIQLDSQTQPPSQQVHRKLDRSHSEPASSSCKAAAAAAATNINTSRYKTELCRPFEESGSCKYGDKCQFAHGAHELRTLVRHPKYKTELCRTYHTIGLCPYGPRCHFVHNDEESLAKPQALPRPKALTLATGPAPSYMGGGSTAESPSPTSSLSQSPTNSHRSFFMSSEDVFGSVSPTPSSGTANTAFSFGQPDFATLVQGQPAPCGSAGSTRESPSPPGSPFRLPIFNHLSNQVMKIRLDV